MKCFMVAVMLVALCGCGSIINGTTQKVPITTNPTGAVVTATGGDATANATSPCTLKLKRKHDHMITVELPGYKPQSVQLQSVVSGAVAGNILAGGLIGWGIDAASGGDSRLVPEAVNITLEPEQAAQPGPTAEKAAALEADLKKIDDMRASGAITEAEYTALRTKTLEKY